MELLLEVLVEPSGWDCVGRISVVVWWVMSLAVVAAAAVEKLETWWPVVCGMGVCGLVVLSMAVACKDEVDAVGACGWSGSWGRKRWSACSGHCLSPEQAAVADASNNDSSNTVAIGHPWGVPGRNS